MDHNDRHAIEGLFGKLSAAERQAGPRDPEAEAFIRDRMAAQPAAPYLMAQTIVVQEQALNAAQQRIEQLEYEMASQPQQSSGGGLFSSLFGSGSRPAAPQRPRRAAPGMAGPMGGSAPADAAAGASGPWGQQGMAAQRPAGGGGFLAGAAQTAMGVAGGVLLGNAIAGMFGGDTANAAEPAAAPPQAEEPAADFGDDEDMGDMEF